MSHRLKTLSAAALLALCHAAHAQAPARQAPSGAQGCVEVEANGQTVRSLGCLSEKLAPPAQAAPRPGAATGAEALVQQPGNALGVFNRAATANRMGSNFGVSVYPQRPPAPAR
ncbi:hypothetical protein GT347_05065 [Xylophilus rhododendri]|uniref:Uncharacterized protein n=1 Tax=Xylophilus rhododendri TaxID=2697032 RepID=A0A857J2R0_9BURK|nr:hypothetical protein [Xylophilus rhododendri]QHI97409.1 hypothetical protein GT347_05065 [Xylophilus rhododendri]